MVWRPAHAEHAIEKASFVINFQENIPKKIFDAATIAASKELIAAGFVPSVAPAEAGTITIELINSNAHPINSDVKAFQMIRSNEIFEEIIIRRKQLIYITSRYPRWSRFKERIESVFGRLIESFLHVSDIEFLKIEYFDRFVFDGDRHEARYEELFKRGTPYIPKFYFDRNDLWHCHAGYFITSGKGYQRLINANVDIVDVAPVSAHPSEHAIAKRSSAIYTTAEDRFWVAQAPNAPGSIEEIFDIADDMHAELKLVLGEIISPALANAISLDSQGG